MDFIPPSGEELAALLPACPSVIVLEEAPGTNLLAKQRAAAGAPHGSLWLAHRQTAGVGRRGRAFASPRGGLYFSILLRPGGADFPAPGQVTAAAAVAVCRAAASLCGRELSIKWVNDLLWKNKKCCGILAEAGWQGDKPQYYVVGIGLNYASDPAAFPPEVAALATSLFPDGQVPAGSAQLVAAIYTELLALWQQLPQTGYMQEYRRRSALQPGQALTVLADPPYAATAMDIDDEARLLVQAEDGRQAWLYSGEISVRLQ